MLDAIDSETRPNRRSCADETGSVPSREPNGSRYPMWYEDILGTIVPGRG